MLEIDNPDFPFAVEFDSPVSYAPLPLIFDTDLPPAELTPPRREFLRIWAKKNGVNAISFDRNRALFRCEDDAVLCRMSILDREIS